MTDPATAEDRPRNQHCMNCGDTRGGPIGHETSECTYDSAANATRRQLDHVAASMQTNRAGWTDQQYLDDARRLLGDVDGSVLDLVNGHVSAMLHEIDRLLSELEAARASTDRGRQADDAPDEITQLKTELEAAQARLNAAAEVHRPVEGFSRMRGTTYLYCWECSDDGFDGDRGHIAWPCETARALGLGEEADE